MTPAQIRALCLTVEMLKERLIYSPDTGIFTRRVACAGRAAGDAAGSVNSKGYIKISVLGHRHSAHRLAWLYVYGEWPKGEIDHINGNRSDNRIENLREATRTINVQNQRSPYRNKKMGLPLGVQFVPRLDKYVAEISSNGERHYLGLFPSKELAYAAYVNAKRKYHEGNTL